MRQPKVNIGDILEISPKSLYGPTQSGQKGIIVNTLKDSHTGFMQYYILYAPDTPVNEVSNAIRDKYGTAGGVFNTNTIAQYTTQIGHKQDIQEGDTVILLAPKLEHIHANPGDSAKVVKKIDPYVAMVQTKDNKCWACSPGLIIHPGELGDRVNNDLSTKLDNFLS